MRVPYHIVVEPQEYDQYAAVIDPARIYVLPFSNLGRGSIPARNWVWEHAISMGAARHWIVDDNIYDFFRAANNNRYKVDSGSTFAAIEDFTDRYENVALSGMQYKMFAPKRAGFSPLILNTRIYSCILINHRLDLHWRGRYNEDTDLSLCALKAGWCTVLFNAFLIDKATTMTVKGGNTDELYRLDDQKDGRLLMAQSLQRQHPDVVKITRKWGRWQHQVDYRPFKGNKLIRREGVEIPDRPNEYGMILRRAT